MKQIKIIQDEQLLEQISGGKTSGIQKKLKAWEGAATAVGVFLGCRWQPKKKQESYLLQ